MECVESMYEDRVWNILGAKRGNLGPARPCGHSALNRAGRSWVHPTEAIARKAKSHHLAQSLSDGDPCQRKQAKASTSHSVCFLPLGRETSLWIEFDE